MSRVVAVLAGCALALAGCSSGDHAESSATGPPHATATMPAVTSLPIVPGGSDPVCTQLASETSVTGLSAVVSEAAVSGVSPDVASAAAALDAVGGSFPSAVSAASSLRIWAAAPADPTLLDALAAAFAALDSEVQAVCQFPLS